MSSSQLPENAPTLLAIGNFDGVHLGHQHLLRQVVDQALGADLIPSVMTFDPHPAKVLGRGKLETLTSLRRKTELLRGLHPQLRVIVETFDLELAQMSPRQFAEQLLRDKHHARQVVVGENFRFGYQRQGNLETLEQLGAQLGFSAQAAPLLQDERAPISSSRIRDAIRSGQLEHAQSMLGRAHALSGVVVSGDRRGRTLGYPTANLAQVEEMLPPSGVYAGLARIVGEAGGRPAIANLGVRPTLDGGQALPSVEVHLLDYQGDLYGRELEFELSYHLRPERRFGDLQALRSQIARDVAEAGRLLRS